MNMTEGNIPKNLIKYSIPLILGNMFQLTYNAVDSIIVGRFAGKESLAAVGTANPVMNIVILGISGICLGASVLMSEFYGAGETEKLKREFSTTLLFGCYFSIAIAVLGALLSKPLLALMNVPAEILNSSARYLSIIFLGFPFTYFYNAVAAALRSMGDSKTPIKFLALASVLNGGLDLFFVGALKWDVAGAALATNLAEATSAILCFSYVYQKVPALQLKKSDLHMDKLLLKRTLQYGSITALQQSCQPIGKLLIQGVVNPLGVNVIAAFNAVNRVDDFAFTPEQSISHGMTTFIAQNRGAGKNERIRSGFRMGLLLEFLYWVIIFSAILLFKEPIMKLFVTQGDTQIVALGVDYLYCMAFFYLLPAFTNGIQGFFRGMGDMKITLISTMIQITVRVIFVYLLAPSMGMQGIAYACFAGWVAMLSAEVPYYFWYKKQTDLLHP